MAYLHKFNYDDVFFRSISIGLLNVLNDKLSIWNRISDTEYEPIPIPFFYDSNGDERFMQDVFMGDTLDDCVESPKVEGNIDRIPRGHISWGDATINTALLTSRFVRGEFRKETLDGKLITYNAPLNHIPLDISYDCKIIVDTELNMLKTVQRLIEVFYKVHVFEVMFGGFIIKAQTSFPEGNNIETQKEHTYGDNTTRYINFQLGVETYLPVIDPTQEFLKSQRIEQFGAPITPQRFVKSAKYVFNDFERDIYSNREIKPTDEEGKDFIFIPTDSNTIVKI